MRKSPYLATMEIIQKWTLPRQNWGLTLAQLTIQFNNKLNKILA
ncbi:conserved domain protein [Clostridium botulinum A2 str. Kyoto]|uniref:Conserved domain protein n=1 Tax=Clostridium botulinum (strain Kyoto / Type A2) TaxID=536232 RepID=C1FTV0_CLOBJ|nr:conserved domain protein [Clostridium botulinum A2 str. Kyoto]